MKTDGQIVRTEQLINITGMTCQGCVASVTKVLGRVPGVQQVQVDLASGEAHVAGSAARADLEQAIRSAGFGVAST